MAFEPAHSPQPNIIVRDISMPGMSGLELIKRIRTQETSRSPSRTIAIAVTATTTTDDR